MKILRIDLCIAPIKFYLECSTDTKLTMRFKTFVDLTQHNPFISICKRYQV